MKRVIASALATHSDQERFLQWICDNFRVNGPYSRGDAMPDPIDTCINEANFPDNIRFKNYFCDVFDDGLEIKWVTQDPFTGEDAEQGADEIVRFLEAMYEWYLKYENPDANITFPTGTIEMVARDGRDYGFYLRDI